ncbi:MAG: hypothetical protein M1368_05250, partial [Thaumarchaeota archaeon]|nr:hypothetical protein [Nitrososphaerota archaeon]
TRNLVKFVEFCDECSISLNDIVIMTPINRLGFQMTPSKEECEKCLRRKPEANIIGMSVLAAGQINLSEAVSYVRQFKSVRSIAIGVSSQAHAEETFRKLSMESE